jgi:hypothetical protein
MSKAAGTGTIVESAPHLDESGLCVLFAKSTVGSLNFRQA